MVSSKRDLREKKPIFSPTFYEASGLFFVHKIFLEGGLHIGMEEGC